MTSEQKQIKAFLATIRQHNQIINEQLALLLIVVGKIRSSYLTIDDVINEFEAKLEK